MNLPFICLLIKSINFKIYLFRNSLSFIKCRWFTISCSMFPLSLLWLRISWFVDCFTYLYNSEVGALLGQGWFELPISVQGGKIRSLGFWLYPALLGTTWISLLIGRFAGSCAAIGRVLYPVNGSTQEMRCTSLLDCWRLSCHVSRCSELRPRLSCSFHWG